jgi:hypothetical protein
MRARPHLSERRTNTFCRLSSGELMKSISFDGPIAAALREKASAVEKLKGEYI